ncbi:arginase family protein [Actinoplanes sp. NPDC000266]
MTTRICSVAGIDGGAGPFVSVLRATMAAMTARWGVLGVPSSAGAHTPGLEKGPAAVRDAGLVDLLPGGAQDHGDVSAFRWRPDTERPNAKNAAAVARIATETAIGVAGVLAAGQIPFVVGGDCSITIGVVAGFLNHGVRPALLYFDGGPDLYTPETRPNGNIDAMVLAHLLATPGHVPLVAGVGPVVPLVGPQDVVSYGHTLPPEDTEFQLLNEFGIDHVSADEIHADPLAAAQRARHQVEKRQASFLVHLDVDVLSFNDVPLADVPDSGGDPAGLTLEELIESLSVFASSPSFAGLVLTELNPDHAPDVDAIQRFLTAIGKALPVTPQAS